MRTKGSRWWMIGMGTSSQPRMCTESEGHSTVLPIHWTECRHNGSFHYRTECRHNGSFHYSRFQMIPLPIIGFVRCALLLSYNKLGVFYFVLRKVPMDTTSTRVQVSKQLYINRKQLPLGRTMRR